jgi:hypothetical protein
MTTRAEVSALRQQPRFLTLPPPSVFRLSSISVFAFFVLYAAQTATASTVSIQGGFGYPAAIDATGQPVEAGYEVAIGTFPDGFVPADHAADLPALLAAWRPYGITTTREIFGTPGSFYLAHVNNDPFFAGKRIYLLLTRTNNHASPASDASNVTDYGVFTSLATPADSASTWTFPLVGPEVQPPADLRQLNTSQIDSSLFGALDTGSPTLAWKAGSSTDPSAWDNWVRSVFGENTDPSSIDPDAVTGSSGLKNFVAFALATNPVAPAAPAYETTTHPEDGRIGIRFTRKKAKVSGYTAEPEASTDLSDWTLALDKTIKPESDTTESITAYLPAGSTSDKAFFRIQVEPIQN